MRRGVFVLLCLFLTTLEGQSTEAREARSAKEAGAPGTPDTDFFEAMAAGEIDVKLIPQNSKTGTVIVTNTADRPLTIKLPEAFAAKPIVAQRGGGGAAGGGVGRNVGGGLGGNQ